MRRPGPRRSAPARAASRALAALPGERTCSTPPAGSAATPQLGRSASGRSIHAALEQAVVALAGTARPAHAAQPVERLDAHLQLLIGHRPVHGGPLRQVAPTAAREEPHPVPGVGGLEPVLPLQRLPDIAALAPRVGR